MRRLLGSAAIVAAMLLSACSSGPGPKPAARKTETHPPAKILLFYASPAAVEAGDTVSVCYGVDDATAVRLEPAVEAIEPSPNRCLQLKPTRSQDYTLIATGSGGEVRQTVSVRVEPRRAKPAAAAPATHRMIDTFAASTQQVAKGQAVTLCYAVREATSVNVTPAVPGFSGGNRSCTTVNPTETTTYTLSASGAGGTETEKVTIKVH